MCVQLYCGDFHGVNHSFNPILVPVLTIIFQNQLSQHYWLINPDAAMTEGSLVFAEKTPAWGVVQINGMTVWKYKLDSTQGVVWSRLLPNAIREGTSAVAVPVNGGRIHPVALMVNNLKIVALQIGRISYNLG